MRLPQVAGSRDYTIVSLEDGVARRVKAVALAPVLRRPDRTRMPELPRSDGGNVAGPPVFHLLDLPMWPGVENQNAQFRIACYAKPWREVALYSSPEDSEYQLRTMVPYAAVMGELATGLIAAASGRLMHQQSFDVRLYHGELQSQTLRQVLNAANTALVQNADGSWEILQFLEAEEVAAGHWRLKTLLRGQCGTEEAARSEKQTGAAFVLLDDRVVPAGLQKSDAGLLLNWRAGSAGREFSDAYFRTQSSVGGVKALQPLSPVHLRYKRQNNAEMLFEWVRRGRIDADSWMGEDIPLGEVTERYQVQLWRDETLLLKSEVTQPRFVYTGQVQSGDLLRIEVAQVSQAYGAGAAATLSFRS